MKKLYTFKEFILEYQKTTEYSFSQFCKLHESPQGDFENDGVFADEMLAKEMELDTLHQFRLSGFMKDIKPITNYGDKESKKFNVVIDSKKHEVYIGFINDGVFNVLGKMAYKDSLRPVDNSIIVTKIITHSEHRRDGLASAIYKSLMKEGYTIVSDSFQYKGAINLWKGFYDDSQEWKTLIDDTKIQVQIYDIALDKIIAKNVRTANDTDIWSKDTSLKNIRLVAFLK
ncbi:MAG: hypothetical protein PHF21_03305 [Bacilli bacterium]|nr:hypothetical protein [Bacilli bacterium]